MDGFLAVSGAILLWRTRRPLSRRPRVARVARSRDAMELQRRRGVPPRDGAKPRTRSSRSIASRSSETAVYPFFQRAAAGVPARRVRFSRAGSHILLAGECRYLQRTPCRAVRSTGSPRLLLSPAVFPVACGDGGSPHPHRLTNSNTNLRRGFRDAASVWCRRRGAFSSLPANRPTASSRGLSFP